MAFYRTLSEGWRLTDGILPAFLMEKPCPVYEALLEAGCLPDAEKGMNAMSCEWIAARRWTYELMLEAPGEDDERCLVELPRAAGSGCAYLNGELLGSFGPGAVRFDLTGALREEGENRLRIEFDPVAHLRPDAAMPVPEIGLTAAPVMRAVNYVTLNRIRLSSRVNGDKGVIEAEFDLTAHTAGKYLFRYALSLDGEAAVQFELTEKLPAARRTVKQEICVDRAVFFDAGRMEETVYGIKLTIERGGVGCDVRHMETAFRRDASAGRYLAAHGWPLTCELSDRLISLGADGVYPVDRPDNAFEQNDFFGGLTVCAQGDIVSEGGMLSAEDIGLYAAGEKAWPADGALWRLRGGAMPADCGDLPLSGYARAVRYRQAAAVMARAEEKRRMKEPCAVRADGQYAFLADDAIIERSGKLRPAAAALAHAWKTSHIFAALPQGDGARPGELVQLPVWALVETLRGRVMTASVRALTMDGREAASSVLPVMGGDVRLAGVLTVRMPEDGAALIIRAELLDADGSCLDRADSLLMPGGRPDIRALAALPAASLTRIAGKVRCEGAAAAVSAGLCLTPGEETEDAGLEWLNEAD